LQNLTSFRDGKWGGARISLVQGPKNSLETLLQETQRDTFKAGILVVI